MEISISKKIKSIGFQSGRLQDLDTYLRQRSKKPVEYEIKVNDNETIKTSDYQNFAKELDGIDDWKKIQDITITQYDFDKGFTVYLSFEINGSAFSEGYRLSIKGKTRDSITGVASEIERKLQLKRTRNSMAEALVVPVFVVGWIIFYSLLHFLDKLLADGATTIMAATIAVLVFGAISSFFWSPWAPLNKIYPRVVLEDRALGKITGRIIEKDVWKFLLAAVVLVGIPIIVNRL